MYFSSIDGIVISPQTVATRLLLFDLEKRFTNASFRVIISISSRVPCALDLTTTIQFKVSAVRYTRTAFQRVRHVAPLFRST